MKRLLLILALLASCAVQAQSLTGSNIQCIRFSQAYAVTVSWQYGPWTWQYSPGDTMSLQVNTWSNGSTSYGFCTGTGSNVGSNPCAQIPASVIAGGC